LFNWQYLWVYTHKQKKHPFQRAWFYAIDSRGHADIDYDNFYGFVKSGLFRWGGIFAVSNSKRRSKPVHTVISSGSEKSLQQDSSSLSFPGMTVAERSGITIYSIEFLGSGLCRRGGIFAVRSLR